MTLFLPPRGTGRRIPKEQYVIWILLNTVVPILVAAMALRGHWLLPTYWVGGTLLFLLLLHLFVLIAAQVIIYEDYDVMDGVTHPDRRAIKGEHASKRPFVIFLSLLCFLIYAGFLIYWINEIQLATILTSKPNFHFEFINYALVVLWSLPSDIILRHVSRLTNIGTPAIYSNSLLGNLIYFGLYYSVGLLFLNLVFLIVQQEILLRRMIIQLGDSEGDQRRFLREKILRAPGVIKRRLLRYALACSNTARKKKLIQGALSIGVFTFPGTLCRNLLDLDRDVQLFSLDQLLVFAQRFRDKFDQHQFDSLMGSIRYHLRRKRSDPEIIKRLLSFLLELVAGQENRLTMKAKDAQELQGLIGRHLRRSDIRWEQTTADRLRNLRFSV